MVPPELRVTFDIRIANDIELEEFEKMVDIFEYICSVTDCFKLLNTLILHRLINGAKKLEVVLNRIIYTRIRKHHSPDLMTRINTGLHSKVPLTNCMHNIVFYIEFAIQVSYNFRKLKVKTKVFPGATDSRYIRRVNKYIKYCIFLKGL